MIHYFLSLEAPITFFLVSAGGICAAKIVTIGSAGLLKYCVQF